MSAPNDTDASDVIRVLRVVEYVGPRSRVEDTLRRLLPHVFGPSSGMTITVARLDDPIVEGDRRQTVKAVMGTAEINAALDRARAENARLAALAIAACTALEWPLPRTESERNNGARDAADALQHEVMPDRWRRVGAGTERAHAQWFLFRDKVRELNAIPEGPR